MKKHGVELPMALSLEDRVAGERLINTRLRRSMARSQIASREFMCGRSAELSAASNVAYSHVAGEGLLDTTLRRSMARLHEFMCGRPAKLSAPSNVLYCHVAGEGLLDTTLCRSMARSRELSAPGCSIVCSCSSSVDSTDSCDEIVCPPPQNI